MSKKDIDPLDHDDDLPADEGTSDSPLPPPDTLRILEAVLFASDELLTTARLKTIIPGNPDAREIAKMVEQANRNLQKERHPFEIVEIGGGYQFKTVAYYHPWVRQIFQDKAAKRLSIQALECLSIIAYRQPLSKAEIEAIRGVLSDGAMKTLLEKRLITVVGRSEKAGKALLYGTTQDFLKYFGLNKINDLPKIEEFEAMVRAKMEQLPIEELKNVEQKATDEAAASDAATIEIAAAPDAVPAGPSEEASIEIALTRGTDSQSGDAATTPTEEDSAIMEKALMGESSAEALNDLATTHAHEVMVDDTIHPETVLMEVLPEDAGGPAGGPAAPKPDAKTKEDTPSIADDDSAVFEKRG